MNRKVLTKTFINEKNPFGLHGLYESNLAASDITNPINIIGC